LRIRDRRTITDDREPHVNARAGEDCALTRRRDLMHWDEAKMCKRFVRVRKLVQKPGARMPEGVVEPVAG